MKTRSWTTGLVAASMLFMASVQATETMTSDGYSVEDYQLQTAQDLVDICTIKKGHPDHDIARSFCYGFFEGAIHYDTALEGTPAYVDIVCSPEGTTRTLAVIVFAKFMQSNPQYGSDKPIDGVFRALGTKWPCPE